MRESSDGRPVQKFDGCLETLSVGLSEIPDSTALKWFSDNSQRDVLFDKDVVRRTDWSGGRAADIVRGNLSKSDPEEMEYHWLRSG